MVLRREGGLCESMGMRGELNCVSRWGRPGGLGGQRIKGLRARCRLGVRLCDREKDLHELFLRRVRGLEFAKEARGKVEGSRRACSKKERDWWVRVTRCGERSASI